jgi:iron-sulfur cluster assembly accessory protein
MTTQPVTFTDAAVKHIKKMVEQNSNNIGFRLSVKETGCSGYSYVPKVIEQAVAGDINYLVQDDLQIFVDPASLPYLNQILVDYVVEEAQGLKQKRLVFINPNEKNRCGCGESFTIE